MEYKLAGVTSWQARVFVENIVKIMERKGMTRLEFARRLGGVRPSARILDHTRNLEPVGVRVDGTRLLLPKEGRDSASYVVIWETCRR